MRDTENRHFVTRSVSEQKIFHIATRQGASVARQGGAGACFGRTGFPMMNLDIDKRKICSSLPRILSITVRTPDELRNDPAMHVGRISRGLSS